MDSNKTKKMKFIAMIISLVIIIVVVLYVIQFIILVPFFTDESSSDEYIIPEITLLTTASSVSINPTSYVPSISFTMGEKIWVYQEYTNISHKGVSDYYLSLSVFHSNGDKLGFVEDHIDTNKTACFYYFNTNGTWPTGLYLVSSKLVDNISNETVTEYTNFYLSDVST